jgi:hypothetical protein
MGFQMGENNSLEYVLLAFGVAIACLVVLISFAAVPT